MKIRFFAGLKDYFGSEIDSETIKISSVIELLEYLKERKPEASELLKKSRFAVNNSFISNDYSLQEVEEVLVMPPSSGG